MVGKVYQRRNKKSGWASHAEACTRVRSPGSRRGSQFGFSRFSRSQLSGLLFWLEFVKSSLLVLRFRRDLLLSWYKCQTFWSNRFLAWDWVYLPLGPRGVTVHVFLLSPSSQPGAEHGAASSSPGFQAQASPLALLRPQILKLQQVYPISNSHCNLLLSNV